MYEPVNFKEETIPNPKKSIMQKIITIASNCSKEVEYSM